ncbi:hypothetical protein IIC65_08980, partial [Candidatus Sumerlaeota bacterium]|nr:hypothetical protein [Candidatus Sumerlaeota bacterium]
MNRRAILGVFPALILILGLLFWIGSKSRQPELPGRDSGPVTRAPVRADRESSGEMRAGAAESQPLTIKILSDPKMKERLLSRRREVVLRIFSLMPARMADHTAGDVREAIARHRRAIEEIYERGRQEAGAAGQEEWRLLYDAGTHQLTMIASEPV